MRTAVEETDAGAEVTPASCRLRLIGERQGLTARHGDRCAAIELALARKSEKIFVTRELCHADAMQIISFCMAAF